MSGKCHEKHMSCLLKPDGGIPGQGCRDMGSHLHFPRIDFLQSIRLAEGGSVSGAAGEERA